MSTTTTWPGGATDATPTAYSIPASGELNWAALSNFLNVLATSAQSTTAQKWGMRKALTTPVTVSATADCVVVTQLTSPGAVVVNLPAGANKQVFCIVDGTGDAGTNNVTINRAGSDTIAGATTLVLNANRQAVVLVYNSSDTDWKIVSRSNLNISSGLTGILPTANGGTGQNSTATFPTSATNNADFVMKGAVNQSVAGIKTFSDTTDASSATVGGAVFSGGIAVAKQLFSGSAVISTTGMKFKDTGAGSTTITWYEEGTWTPVLAFSTLGTATLTTNICRFTRIGNRVCLSGIIEITKGTASGTLTLTGLPYASSNPGGSFNQSLNVLVLIGVTFPANRTCVGCYVSNNSQTMNPVFQTTNAAVVQVVTAADLAASSQFCFEGQYQVG